LSKYRIDENERERLLFSVLKRIYLSEKETIKFFQKYRNDKLYGRIERTYGKESINDLCSHLAQSELISAEPGTRYTLTNKGIERYKRGWIDKKINKYENPKYAILISILALIISVLFNNHFWEAVIWIWNKIVR